MKTAKLLVAIAAVTLLAASCTEKHIYYENNLSTTIYTIKPSHWEINEIIDADNQVIPGSDNYFFCTVDNKDITDEVMDRGSVQAFVYYTYNKEENLSAWSTLPFICPVEYIVTEEGVTSSIIVPENLRFEWEKGSVTFILQALDGFSPNDIKNTMSIKVCVGL